MRKTTLISIVLLVGACTSLTTTTGYRGINYGNSYEKVLEKLGRNAIIVEKSEDMIIAIGLWEVTGDCREINFKFFEGQGLQQVSYEPAPNRSVDNGCE